mmetsp:Transcript_15625/g.41370  ORF Transcript_15625/g.41370 Transcript_15625/m.41370 type:complete len:203 (-) Transcript_15625:135-743(-)
MITRNSLKSNWASSSSAFSGIVLRRNALSSVLESLPRAATSAHCPWPWWLPIAINLNSLLEMNSRSPLAVSPFPGAERNADRSSATSARLNDVCSIARVSRESTSFSRASTNNWQNRRNPAKSKPPPPGDTWAISSSNCGRNEASLASEKLAWSSFISDWSLMIPVPSRSWWLKTSSRDLSSPLLRPPFAWSLRRLFSARRE